MKKKNKNSFKFLIAIPIVALLTVGAIFANVLLIQNVGQSDVNDLLNDFEKEFSETTPVMPELEDGTDDDFTESTTPVITVPDDKKEDNSEDNKKDDSNGNDKINTNKEQNNNASQKTETQSPEVNITEPEEKDYKEYSNTIGIIEIPSIKVKAPIAFGTSNKILNKQVGQYKTTDSLGQLGGSTGFAAHSGEKGWKCSYCYFNDIGKLKKGAEIIVKWQDGKTYVYEVTEVKQKQDPKTPFVYERDEDESRITLTTCTNGNGKYRTFVRGILKEIK